MTDLQLIEIDSESELPEGMYFQVHDGELHDALLRFKVRHGFDCRVVYKLRGRWWMVLDPEYKVEVGK